MGVEILSDILERLDELVIAVLAASSGGFIGGWMALRAANASIEQSVRASREERRAAEIERRVLVLVALEAELRLNAALLSSEQAAGYEVAPAWRIPFRDAYVTALPYLAGLPPAIQATLQQTAVVSSHYVSLARGHQAEAAPAGDASEARRDVHARLDEMAPGVSELFLRAADELSAYLHAAGIAAPGVGPGAPVRPQ